jgi:hypothetical protein
MEKPSSGQRPRTCRACGKKFEYPVKGSNASRHHCEDCIILPADVRKIFERLSTRVTQLENQVKRLQPAAPKPVVAPAPPGAPEG